jgi:hypothetical protein
MAWIASRLLLGGIWWLFTGKLTHPARQFRLRVPLAVLAYSSAGILLIPPAGRVLSTPSSHRSSI